MIVISVSAELMLFYLCILATFGVLLKIRQLIKEKKL